MSYTLLFTDSYQKSAKRFTQQLPELKEPYHKTLLLPAQNPYHPSLRLHPLKDKLAALHSVSINIRYRITLEMIITQKEIIPVNVGNHDEVYQI